MRPGYTPDEQGQLVVLSGEGEFQYYQPQKCDPFGVRSYEWTWLADTRGFAPPECDTVLESIVQRGIVSLWASDEWREVAVYVM